MSACELKCLSLVAVQSLNRVVLQVDSEQMLQE